ncbi:MAG: tRNA lysidine(34) synthetase TilS [Bacteroidia bacterium]|nr:tRNA lysidine(34) synthetase TilS [Bacteroidia bacterium]MDW8157956.1 tRNA lysidine(34) synthetase TilS [Bacteroidia bacterium]
MKKKVEAFIQSNKLFTKAHKLLVAFSGGRDSVVLTHVLLSLGYNNLILAHCNFQLRAQESDLDETFCNDFAQTYDLPIKVKKFNVLEYARQNRLSIQVAARRLRYDWLNKLVIDFNYDHILTAHHASDLCETLLYNLLRSKDFDILQNIPLCFGKTLRPLLCVTREEINNYVFLHGLPFREDSSNQKNDYVRNFIRNRIIPLLKEINPALEVQLSERSSLYKKQLYQLTSQWQSLLSNCLVSTWFGFRLDFLLLEKLFQEKAWDLELFITYWLEDQLGCNYYERKEIFKILKGRRTGSRFENARIIFHWNRGYVEVFFREKLPNLQSTLDPLDYNRLYFFPPFAVEIQKVQEYDSIDWQNNKTYFTLSKINGRLKLRFWKEGDIFQPWGSKYKRKVSDILRDAHVSTIEKKYAFIIEDREKIIYLSFINQVSQLARFTEGNAKEELFEVKWKYL